MKILITICGCKLKFENSPYEMCEHGRSWEQFQGELYGRPMDVPLPIIVCLCGSTRFWRTFQQASLEETLAGKIVLSIGAASASDDNHFGNLAKEEYDHVKRLLDILHFRKIDLAGEVYILNVGGYIGESTARELAYAEAMGKKIRFWETEANSG